MKKNRKIYITDFDLQRLRNVLLEAENTGYRGSEYLTNLKEELDSAQIVRPTEVPPDVITMNSKVRVADLDRGEEMVFTLVYPQDADIQQDKLSILAPIGTALLGYRVGDQVEYEVPAGVTRLEVRELLYQPESSGDYDL
jgi:regulator of nucleoside diphosphate kinase